MIRDSLGKWIDTTPFRQPAITFMEHGAYCNEPWGSDRWYDYWHEERRRCIEGYEVEGERITGDHYFYLNFCPIQKVEDASSKKSKKVKGFPDFWDGDYEYFWTREIARNGISQEDYEKLKLRVKVSPEHLGGGYNLIAAKSRRRGYSYKSAAIAAKNFFCIPNSLTILGAEDKKYLYPKGLFSMAYDYISFINSNTAWAAPSDVINKPAQGHIKSSYIEYRNGIKIEAGFKSEILSLTFADNASAARGKDCYDMFFEEAGAFGTPGLLKDSYFASLDCVKAGSIKTGMITLFGCVCKGTKVWTPKGHPKRIEDITAEDGIVGYGAIGTTHEPISWLRPPGKKECVRIKTVAQGSLECSIDHPVLYADKEMYDKGLCTFKYAGDIQKGDYILEVSQIPVFGKMRMWNPRLVGLLIGDGYYGGSSSPQLSISDPKILEYIDSIGIGYSVYEKKSSDSPFHRYITLHLAIPELRALGIHGQSKKSKRLPSNIHDYDMESIKELLGGLFDSDGYVSKNQKKMRITLTSTIPEMLEQVKDCLYKLGISCKVFRRDSKRETELKSNVNKKSYVIPRTISYSLEIQDHHSIMMFKKHIQLKSFKADRLESLTPTQGLKVFRYIHTIDKGRYFIDNPEFKFLRGRRVTSVESIGEQDIYNLTADYTHTYITNGFVSHNTSGEMSGGTVDFANMYERPEAFELLPMSNIWDEGSIDQQVGFFHPCNWNMEGFYDKQGNSDAEGAREDEVKAREKLKDKGATSVEMQKRLQEKPLSPSEAFAVASINNFPTAELKRQLQKVKSYPKGILKGVPVELIQEGTDVIAKPILHGDVSPITSYTNVPEDISGAVVIYEQPSPTAPKGLYKIGYDPVRQDTGTSLAAIIVYKGVHATTQYKNIVVAEYIGRLESAEDIDRVAEKLAIYYNTTIMHENEVTSVKNYFRRIKRLDLLAVQPDAVISANVKHSRVARVYGCHMNDRLKDAGERYIKDWLLEVSDYDENGSPIRNLDNIYSTRLLEELISYNRRGNFDLVSALIMCMIQVQEEALGKVYNERVVHKNAAKLLELFNGT